MLSTRVDAGSATIQLGLGVPAALVGSLTAYATAHMISEAGAPSQQCWMRRNRARAASVYRGAPAASQPGLSPLAGMVLPAKKPSTGRDCGLAVGAD